MQEASGLGQDPHARASFSRRFKHMNLIPWSPGPCVRWAAAGSAAGPLPARHAARRARVQRGCCCCAAEGQGEGCSRHTLGSLSELRARVPHGSCCRAAEGQGWGATCLLPDRHAARRARVGHCAAAAQDGRCVPALHCLFDDDDDDDDGWSLQRTEGPGRTVAAAAGAGRRQSVRQEQSACRSLQEASGQAPRRSLRAISSRRFRHINFDSMVFLCLPCNHDVVGTGS